MLGPSGVSNEACSSGCVLIDVVQSQMGIITVEILTRDVYKIKKLNYSASRRRNTIALYHIVDKSLWSATQW